MKRRVVITGIGVLSALGDSPAELFRALQENKTAVRRVDCWNDIEGLKTRLAAPIEQAIDYSAFPQKLLRSAGKVAHYSLLATRRAVLDAGLPLEGFRGDPKVGVAYGSGLGGWSGFEECARFMQKRTLRGISASVYHKLMSHTCAMHVSLGFGIQGRVLCTSSACTSGSQAIGFGYEQIAEGRQDLMICGGAEELNDGIVSMFDVLCACSLRQDQPSSSPAPFDQERDGMVVGEGACTLVLESLEHAEKRGAKVFAELIGFSTNSDATHITNPNSELVEYCFRDALEQADCHASSVGYVNAHATGTKLGDLAEAKACYEVYGEDVPVSSLKGHLGHTLGACGAIETALTVESLRRQWIPPTRNLTHPDPECSMIQHVVGDGIEKSFDIAVSNTIAFGGVNTSLVLKRWCERN